MKEQDYLPKHHALLYSYIVKNIEKSLGQSSEQLISDLTIGYGKSRGFRMAKRAIKDGCNKDAQSFLSYGELNVPPDSIERTYHLEGEDAIVTTYKCPWYDAWVEEGHLNYGQQFCDVFDEALARGYGEHVDMCVPQTLARGKTCCKFVFKGTNYSKSDSLEISKKNSLLGKKATKSFLYHMGHLYNYMEVEIVKNYGEVGSKIMSNALDDYQKRFDKIVVDDILRMSKVDFGDISDYHPLNE